MHPRCLGCEALGKIGGKAQIAKIKIVAETDYFVADACSKAIQGDQR